MGADGGWLGHVLAAAAAVTQTAFLRPCSPGTASAKNVQKLTQGGGGSQARGQGWAARGREPFLLLSHGTRASHVARSYEAAQGDRAAPWGTKLRGLSLILKSVNVQSKKKKKGLPQNHGGDLWQSWPGS